MRVLVLLLLFPAFVVRPSDARASAAPVDSASIQSTFTIQVRGGPDLHAVLVEPWPQGFIRLTDATKERTFVPLSKIRAIRDDQGRNRTKDVLARREVLGELPSTPEPEPPRVITTPITAFVVRKDSILIASRVERTGTERITATRTDGVRRDLPSYQVRWMRGLDGQDYRNDVVNHGRVVEEKPILIGYPGPHSNSFGLRGQPKPECSGFPFVQVGFLGRLGSERDYVDAGMTALIEAGGMKNIDCHWSLGANASFGTDARFSRVSFSPRGRLWLTPSTTVDASAGILYADALEDGRRSSTAKPGYSAGLAVGYKDLVSATGVLESFEETYQVRGDLPLARTGPITFHERHTSLLLGMKFGGPLSFPGFIAAIAILASTTHSSTFSPR